MRFGAFADISVLTFFPALDTSNKNVDTDVIAEVDELAKKMYHDDAFIEDWIADYIERVIM